ncbi:MAG: GNAT family N-acetyltransferase [Oscillospiraceae bacterium]
MKIETERLELIVLNARRLKLWVDELPTLERELCCHYKAEPLEGFFLEIVRGQLEITESEPNNYMWHSFWLMIRKSDRVVVGSLDFKKAPDSSGNVEIGYGLGRQFESNGYMSEAVKAICAWAFAQQGVAHVTAETEIDGYASQRVLRRCGFALDSEGQTLWWKL